MTFLNTLFTLVVKFVTPRNLSAGSHNFYLNIIMIPLNKRNKAGLLTGPTKYKDIIDFLSGSAQKGKLFHSFNLPLSWTHRSLRGRLWNEHYTRGNVKCK